MHFSFVRSLRVVGDRSIAHGVVVQADEGGRVSGATRLRGRFSYSVGVLVTFVFVVDMPIYFVDLSRNLP